MRISDWSSDVCSSDLVGNDGAHTLAAARGGHGQEMGGAVIAQQLAGPEGSTNQKIALVSREGAHVIDSTEGGRAEQRVAAALEGKLPEQGEEDDARDPGNGAGHRRREERHAGKEGVGTGQAGGW